MSMQKYIDILEGAMMDDEGTYIFSQGSNTSISIRANSAHEAESKLREALMNADDMGIHFSEEPWEIVTSY